MSFRNSNHIIDDKSMKRIILAILIASSMIALSSCGGERRQAKLEAQQRADSLARLVPVERREWLTMDPLDLEMKPIKAFSRDWMALATGSSKTMNAMTISWGTIGELWGKNVVIVYVSSDRRTKAMLDKNSYFTLSSFPQSLKNREMLSYIGSHSYNDEPDKVANSGLLVDFTELGNPRFKQASMTIECKKIYTDEFKKSLMPDDVRRLYDDLGVHSFYIGEIVNVFVKNTDGVDEQIQKEEAQ